MKRNKLYSVIKMTLAGTLMGTLAACGGGSDSSSGNTASTGSSVGPVTGFGSVYVNGTHFNVNNARYTGNDGIERYSQLEKGMILNVRGDWDIDGEGIARVIYYDDTLRGPVETMTWDTAAKTGVITIAGLDVNVDSRTVFKGATPAELLASVNKETSAVDYRVRISGYRLADGTFQAAFVGARKVGSAWPGGLYEIEVEGVVSDLDTGAQTFRINKTTESDGLLVNYGVKATFEDGNKSDLKNGVVVEIESDGKLTNGELIASEIEFEDDFFNDDDDVEMSGAITEAYDADTGQFQLNGFAILINEDTDLDDDLTLNHLTEGAEIKVEGEYRNGIIVAEELEMREGDAELSGFIESKEQGGEVLIVSGVRVMLTGSTLIEDDDSENVQGNVTMRTQDLENLNVDDYIEIEGRETAANGGGLIAYYIERDDDTDLELEGKITQLTGNSVTVLGLELLIDPSNPVSLTGLAVDSNVEIKFEFNEASGTYYITEIEKDD